MRDLSGCFLWILFLLRSISGEEDCDGLLKAVLRHNSPEFVGLLPSSLRYPGESEDDDTLQLSFTWDHIHSLVKDCASFYLLERRAVSYGKISKRESSYHTSAISQPLKNGTGVFGIPSRDCKVYSVQLTVSSSVDGSLYYSQPNRLWPKAYADARVTEVSDSYIRLHWPLTCPLPRRWKLLAISSSYDPVITRSPGLLTGLRPCTPYEIVLEDAGESPIWSTRLSSKPSPPKILVIPGHRTMTVTTTTGDCPSSELTTEITYCSSLEVPEGSGGFEEEEEIPPVEEETCVTRTLSESGIPKRILLKNLSPCTIYSLRFRTVDMSADIAENTVLQEYDAAHSTLCMRRDPQLNEKDEGKLPQTTSTTDGGFWFDHTTDEKEEEAVVVISPETSSSFPSKEPSHRHLSPEIHKPDIRRTHPASSHLGLDVTIGISLGLSCLFILIGATVIASVFHLYYNNKTSPKFSKIAHLELDDDGLNLQIN